jgi:hypothetical protein
MKEQLKRLPKIPPSVKRLIALEALRYPDMPRDFLAQELIEKIKSVGLIPPAEETLKRRISDARQHPPLLSSPYWHMGLQLEEGQGKLPAEAIPKMIEIQKAVKEKIGRSENFKIPVYVAYWIGQLYKTIDDPIALFYVSYAYALYVIVGQAADKDAVAVDTNELDSLLIEKNYDGLMGVALGFKQLLQTKTPENVANDLPEIMTRLKEAINNLSKETENNK